MLSALKRYVLLITSKILKHNFNESLKSLLVAIIIALILRTLLFEPFSIPSSSMYPGLKIGDYLITTKYTYGYSKHSLPFSPPLFEGRIFSSTPKRGDVVIFKGANDPHQFYVKRVIGLPNDKIKLTKGVIFINGNPLTRDHIETVEFNLDGRMRKFDVFLEKISDEKEYRIYQDYYTNYYEFPNTTEEFIVKDGHLFMMGDNRNNSGDSRFNYMGTIPIENIVSKVRIVAFAGDYSLEDALKFEFGRMFSLAK